jgi:GT2 family glycosyltransferase
MNAHPDVVLVYSMLRAFGAGVSFFGGGYGLKPWPLTAATSAAQLESANTIPCSSVLARRDVLRRLEGFDEDPRLNAVEDYDLWLRASRTGAIGFVPRVHGYYRVHPGGISRDPDVQRRRAEYLVEKRQLKNFTFREFRERSTTQTLGRNLADVAMTGALAVCQWAGRAARRPVPLWTSGAEASPA